jgi:peptide deformylase
MAVRDILLLGNPQPLLVSEPVQESELAAVRKIGEDLHDTLMDFHNRHGWGRAIAAPQIGVLKRIVSLYLDRPWLILNPVATSLSPQMVEIWDDCMSFPDLLVRVKRHRSLTMTFRDEDWGEQRCFFEGSSSELLQHELDHLDGVLAVAKAIDGASFALQSQLHLLHSGAFANKPTVAPG